MTKAPPLTYIRVTLVAVVLAVVGLWLPWVRKLPVRSADGQAIYTSEDVAGLEPGIHGFDNILAVIIVAVLAVVVLARRRDRHPDLVLILVGGSMLWLFGSVLREYWRVDRYVVESGLYFLVASGLLFVLLGAGTLIKRRVTTITEASRDARIG